MYKSLLTSNILLTATFAIACQNIAQQMYRSSKEVREDPIAIPYQRAKQETWSGNQSYIIEYDHLEEGIAFVKDWNIHHVWCKSDSKELEYNNRHRKYDPLIRLIREHPGLQSLTLVNRAGLLIEQLDLSYLLKVKGNPSNDEIHSLLKALSVEVKNNLKLLTITNSNLSAIQLEEFPQLREARLAYNQITTFQLNGHPQLETLNISRNHLRTFQATNLPKLDSLQLSGNQKLITLQLKNLPSLRSICMYNGGTKLENINLVDSHLHLLFAKGCNYTNITDPCMYNGAKTDLNCLKRYLDNLLNESRKAEEVKNVKYGYNYGPDPFRFRSNWQTPCNHNRDPKGYYQLLGVQSDATQSEIVKAYRQLALQTHPDKTSGNEVTTEAFKKIKEAYEILSEPIKKQAYDRGQWV